MKRSHLPGLAIVLLAFCGSLMAEETPRRVVSYEKLEDAPRVMRSALPPEQDVPLLKRFGLSETQALAVRKKLGDAYKTLASIREAKTKGRFHQIGETVIAAAVPAKDIDVALATVEFPAEVSQEIRKPLEQVIRYQFKKTFGQAYEVTITAPPYDFYPMGSPIQLETKPVDKERSEGMNYDALGMVEQWLAFLVTDEVRNLSAAETTKRNRDLNR